MSDFMAVLSADNPGAALAEYSGEWPLFLADGATISAGPAPYHSSHTLAHLTRCMNEVAGDPLAVWMALCHDAGKLTTPRAMLPHHYGHEERGAILAKIWSKELGLGKEYAEAGAMTALWHMRAARYRSMRAGKKYRLLTTIQPLPFAAQFWRVVDADARARLGPLAQSDWRVILEAQNAGENEQMQMSLLARLGSGRLRNAV